MDEGRYFPLPVNQNWAWETQVKPASVERAPAPAPAIADPGLPALPASSADSIAGLIAARDTEREQIRQRDNDIGVLVSSSKALRREVQTLKVRRWRDEE